jgi:hypothetical protein
MAKVKIAKVFFSRNGEIFNFISGQLMDYGHEKRIAQNYDLQLYYNYLIAKLNTLLVVRNTKKQLEYPLLKVSKLKLSAVGITYSK